jgi:transcriptional regulator with XRE-family HTH domain
MPRMKPRVLPNGDEVRRLRKQRTWTVKELAAETGLGQRTIEKIESGDKPVLKESLSNVAHALDTTLEHLTSPDPSLPPAPAIQFPPDSCPSQINLIFSLQYDRFDVATQLHPLIDSLTKLIGAATPIRVDKVTSGSVIITVTLTLDDLHKLLEAFREGKLAQLRLEAIKPASDNSIVLSLIIASVLNPESDTSEVRGKKRNR